MNQAFPGGLVETASGLVVPAESVRPEPKPAPAKAERRPINVGDVFVLDGVPFRVHRLNGKKREVVLRVAREVRDTTIRKGVAGE